MDVNSTIRIDAPAGAMLGSRTAGLLIFRGIPYAAPPIAQARFAPPRPVAPWRGVRPCIDPTPIAPQGPSRLRGVFGDFEAVQSEDCLSLTLWAPERKAALRPVMVWLHGGAYMTGAGALDCYSGEALARHGDVVVVAPNFRQGALGFLYLPGVSPGNLGLLDQVLALRWIADNIAAFGGDPSRITLFGQSSGASCIRSLMAAPQARGTFRRAILQSAALGRPDRTPAYAESIGRRFAGFLGLDPSDRDGFQRIGIDRLLAAQGEVARSFRVPLGASELPFTPILDGECVLDDATGNWFTEPDTVDRELIIGYNAQEAMAGYSVDPAVLRATPEEALASLQAYLGARAPAEYERLASGRVDLKPVDVLSDFHTDQLFGSPSISFAFRMAASKVKTWVYRFDWQSPAGLGACHCLELPFVFKNLPQWSNAKMVANADPASFVRLASTMQTTWSAFARAGDPNHEGLPDWPALDQAPSMLVFDDMLSVRGLRADVDAAED